MASFPVTHSNLSAAHLGVFLQDKYLFSEGTTCSLLRSGINDTYLLIDGEKKYVFRVYSLNWRTITEIKEEIHLLKTLHENGIAVSYPLPDKEGIYIHTLHAPEGDRFGVLFSFAEGKKVHNFPMEAHFQLGQLMARFHTVTQNKTIQRVTYTPNVILKDPLQQISAFLSADTEEMQFMLSAKQWLADTFSSVDAAAMRQGIIHLDIWFDNMNITEDHQITLFDFDFCGNGWLAFDVAYYILQLHNIDRYDEKIYQPKIDQFLQGYESITPLSEEEKRLIPVLGVSVYFFYLGIQCQRFHNWSNSFLSEDYLKRFINGLVKRYYDIYQLGKV